MRTDAVADGQNGVEVVVVNRPGNLAISLGLNCQVFLDSCLGVKLAVLVNRLQMLADVLLCGLKQVGHRLLRKPDGFMSQPCALRSGSDHLRSGKG